jgi:hypothetical protein
MAFMSPARSVQLEAVLREPRHLPLRGAVVLCHPHPVRGGTMDNRVVFRGRREVASRGRRGILFLPNHPALVDPIILMAALRRPFAPRALADRDAIEEACKGIDKDREKSAERRFEIPPEGALEVLTPLVKPITQEMLDRFSGPIRSYHNDRDEARKLGERPGGDYCHVSAGDRRR